MGVLLIFRGRFSTFLLLHMNDLIFPYFCGITYIHILQNVGRTETRISINGMLLGRRLEHQVEIRLIVDIRVETALHPVFGNNSNIEI